MFVWNFISSFSADPGFSLEQTEEKIINKKSGTGKSEIFKLFKWYCSFFDSLACKKCTNKEKKSPSSGFFKSYSNHWVEKMYAQPHTQHEKKQTIISRRI